MGWMMSKCDLRAGSILMLLRRLAEPLSRTHNAASLLSFQALFASSSVHERPDGVNDVELGPASGVNINDAHVLLAGAAHCAADPRLCALQLPADIADVHVQAQLVPA